MAVGAQFGPLLACMAACGAGCSYFSKSGSSSKQIAPIAPTPGKEMTMAHVTHESFGKTKDGKAVTLFTLTNTHGIVAKIADYGATLVEVRSRLGSDARVGERMKAYYSRVNDHNKVAFADRKPPEVARGESGYAGVEACTTCHDEAREVWNRTRHAHAYATLSSQFKEYNLDCVSCHVTGYEKPGGSTVTMNASLQNVQCEACHGPGQAHVKEPQKPGLIVRDPKPELCAGSCHHPPHVEGFDPVKAKKLVIGPGHGMPSNAPWPAWATDGGTKP